MLQIFFFLPAKNGFPVELKGQETPPGTILKTNSLYSSAATKLV
jgi:hypothetical protein